MQARIVQFANTCMLHISANSVIALLANFPADTVPNLVQVFYLGSEYLFGIAPNTQSTHTFVNGRMGWPRFADNMTVLGETVLPQGLHHLCTVLGCNLNEDTQLFIEQGFEGQFFSSRTNLLSPIFGITILSAAVRNTITFCDQHVQIEGDAYLTCKTHFCHGA